MRQLTLHADGQPAGQLNTMIRVEAGPPGPGGAPVTYHVHFRSQGQWQQAARLDFQDGAVEGAKGPNGLTHEVLLAVLVDRLKGFQGGAFACTANEYALQHLHEALFWLRARTWERAGRGVEGTVTP